MKRICFSDIHGQYDILKQILQYYDDNTQLFFLGDACDRGYQNLKCINALLQDKRIFYFKGNHEEMLLKGLKTILSPEESLSLFFDNFYIWYR